jgi:hypothetical protein
MIRKGMALLKVGGWKLVCERLSMKTITPTIPGFQPLYSRSGGVTVLCAIQEAAETLLSKTCDSFW